MEGLTMKYFVLKPKGVDIYARSSRRAMRAYAQLVRQENPQFAEEVRAWADKEFEDAISKGLLSDEQLFEERGNL